MKIALLSMLVCALSSSVHARSVQIEGLSAKRLFLAMKTKEHIRKGGSIKDLGALVCRRDFPHVSDNRYLCKLDTRADSVKAGMTYEGLNLPVERDARRVGAVVETKHLKVGTLRVVKTRAVRPGVAAKYSVQN